MIIKPTKKQIVCLINNYYPEIIISILFVSYLLFQLFLYKDIPLEEYPFLHQDLWRRLGDSSFYMGDGDTAFMHPPIPSLLYIPFLISNGKFMYLINTFGLILQVFITYKLVKNISKNKNIALVSSLLLFFNFYTLYYSNFYGLVDNLCVTFVLLIIYLWIFSRKFAFGGIIIGFLTGIAGLIQYAGVFVFPMLVLYDLISLGSFKRLWKRRGSYINRTVTALAIFLSFFIYRKLKFGDWMYSKIEHFNFIGINLGGIHTYINHWLVIWSIPIIILSIIGLIFVVIKVTDKKSLIAKISMLFIPYFLFFTIIYSWTDGRFLSYYSFPIYLLAGYGVYALYHISENRIFKTLRGGTFIIIFSLLLVYINLNNQGHPGVQIPPYYYLKTDKEYKFGTQPEGYIPYFLYITKYKNKNAVNPELNYYTQIATPKRVSDFTKLFERENINPEKIYLYLYDEKFVTSQQLSYYSGIIFPYEFTQDLKLSEIPVQYKYLLTDRKLVDNQFFTPVANNSQIYLYERKK